MVGASAAAADATPESAHEPTREKEASSSRVLLLQYRGRRDRKLETTNSDLHAFP